jgi:phage-related protein (TIGR01555 family)
MELNAQIENEKIANIANDDVMAAIDKGGGSPIDPRDMVSNGLAEALLGAPGLGFSNTPTGVGGGSVQLSQTNTLWRNLRWYLISNIRQLLTQAYVEIGIIKALCDIPVLDAFRGGIVINSGQLSEDQIRQLQVKMEEEQDLAQLAQSKIWGRLFGGGALITATDQDPAEPLNIEEIDKNSPLKFIDADLWELYSNNQTLQSTERPIQLTKVTPVHYQYYDQRVHQSRLMLTKGSKAPSLIRARLLGWGLSEVEVLIRSINQFLKASDLTFEVLDEFKLDVFGIKNLTNTLLSPGGDATIRRRVAIANAQKNYNNALVMDSEDTYDHKQLSFTGISETMIGIRMAVASDVRMPLTKLFGISAAGFSSGEDDIENYNAMVESTIRTPAKYQIVKMVKLRCQQLFGFVPDDIMIDFKPLRMLSMEQEENVKTQKFNRVLQATQANKMTDKEFREACNKSNLVEIQLNMSQDVIDEAMAQGDEDMADEEGGESGAGDKAKKGKTTPKDSPPEAKV